MLDAKRVVTFRLGDSLFGIDVRAVQEIIRHQPLTRVPLAHAAVRGLMNLRGQIVSVVDVKERLGIPAGAADAGERMNVVVRTDGGLVSCEVDRVGDVIDLDPSAFEPLPANVSRSVRELVLGICKLDDRFLHVLSVDKIVDFRSRPPERAEGSRAEEARPAAVSDQERAIP